MCARKNIKVHNLEHYDLMFSIFESCFDIICLPFLHGFHSMGELWGSTEMRPNRIHHDKDYILQYIKIALRILYKK